MYYINTVVSYQKKMSVLYYFKLYDLGHINITSIMKRLYGWGGEREGSHLISSCTWPGNFLYFLRTFWKFPGNSVIIPSLDRKRFPPWAYGKLPYRAWENCSRQCKGLFQAQKRKIMMTSKENKKFCYSVIQYWFWTNKVLKSSHLNIHVSSIILCDFFISYSFFLSCI